MNDETVAQGEAASQVRYVVEIWMYKGIHPLKPYFSRNDISAETVETIKTLVMQAVKG